MDPSHEPLAVRTLAYSAPPPVLGIWISPSLHCALEPDLWQVDTDADEGKEHVYFLMRWRPPYQFTMLSASDHPRPDCKEKDIEADDLHSLFLAQ